MTTAGGTAPTIRRIARYGFLSVLLSAFAAAAPAIAGAIDPRRWPVLVSGVLVILLVGAIFVGFLLPFAIALRAVRESLAERAPAQALLVILVSYGTLIVVFAALFVAMSSTGDYNDATRKYFYYELLRQETIVGDATEYWKELHPVDARAFSGIGPRLWSGVDYPAEISGVEVEDIPNEILMKRTSLDFHDVVHFLPRELGRVFLQCLHLSVVTITTLGYGTVSPTAWYSRLATDVLVLTGTFMLVVALGLSLARPGWATPTS